METLLFCIMTKAALSKMYEWTEMNERGRVGAGRGREGATEGVLAKCIGVGEACKHMNEVL